MGGGRDRAEQGGGRGGLGLGRGWGQWQPLPLDPNPPHELGSRAQVSLTLWPLNSGLVLVLQVRIVPSIHIAPVFA